MTVEASLIVPFVLGLLLMLVSLSFLLYDRAAAVQECYVRAYRESIRKTEAAPGADSVRDWGSYFALESLGFSEEKGKEVKSTAAGTVNVPVRFDALFEGGDPFRFTVTMKARVTDPPQAFRRYRRTLAVLGAAAGIGE